MTEIRGKKIAVTGSLWELRSEIYRLIRTDGGIPVNEVNSTTDILVLGELKVTKRGEFIGSRKRYGAP